MDDDELQRRVGRSADYLGTAFIKDGFYSFNGEGDPIEDNPIVSYRGPTTRVVRRTFAEAGFRPGVNKEQFNICWGNPQSMDFMKSLQPG